MTFQFNSRISTAAMLAAMIAAAPVAAQTITFDDAVNGAATYNYDSDGDTVADVIFTTPDPNGFFITGPGEPQAYVDEPGLGSGTGGGPEMRVDFLNGLTDAIGFGYAVSADDDVPMALHFGVFDSSNNLLADVFSDAFVGGSNFPENWVGLTFSGTAAYALFDFNEGEFSAYIIDNVTLGSAVPPGGVPEPGTWLMMVGGLGAAGLGMRRRAKAAAAAV
jgi:hypothetical protein